MNNLSISKQLLSGLLVTTILFLSGCGGNGSSSAPPTTSEPTVTRLPFAVALSPQPLGTQPVGTPEPRGTLPVKGTSPADSIAVSPTPVLYPTTTWKPPQTIVSIPSDWLTYVDEEARYSFKYPPDFQLRTSNDVELKFKYVYGYLPPSKEFRPYVVVEVEENPNDLTIEQFLTSKYIEITKRSDVPPEYLAAMEQMEINGLSAVWDKANPHSEIAIVISAQAKLFNFRLSNGIMVSDLRTVDNASKDIFYQLVNSFNLLSQ